MSDAGANEAELFRKEVLAVFFAPFLDEGKAVAGAAAIDGVLADLGVREDKLREPGLWVSLILCERFCQGLARAIPDPAFFDRCGRIVLTPKYSGALRPLFRTFGTPMFAFNQVAQATPRFNRVGWMKMLERKRGFVKMEYRPVPGAPREHTDFVCRARAAQLAAVPTMFDLAPADITHEACMGRGDDACVYAFSWKDYARAPLRWMGFALGGAAGTALAALAHGGAPAFTLAVGAATGGFAVGRVLELQREVGRRATELFDYHDSLTRSASTNEERYGELLETKAALEQKIDELDDARQKLAIALDEVQALDKAKTDFFANVSHELRTPLTLILGPLGQLLAGRTPANGLPATLGTINRNAERLLELINQLLDLAKVDAGKLQLARVPTDPTALVSGVVSEFSAAAAAKGIAIDLVLAATPAVLGLDARWIETAMRNLLVNALKYARGRVTVTIDESEGAILLTVRDDGSGIEPRDLGRLFDRFAQGSDESRRKGGTGLGLSMVREAARLHGGEALADNHPEGGARFSIRLPRAANEIVAVAHNAGDGVAPINGLATKAAANGATASQGEAALSSTRARVASAAPIPPNALATSAAPNALATSDDAAPALGATDALARATTTVPESAPLVLLAEDNDDLRAFISDVLSSAYRVRAVRNGAEALRLLPDLDPDVIVSDVVMPEMDGFTLCRRLRADERTRALPIILLTARREVGRVLEGFEAGADDYVGKPFHGRELLARVEVHARLRRFVREVAHRERLATLGVLAASVAHQVRNPLTAIISGLSAFRRKLGDTLDGRSREMLDVMTDASRRVERLTKDLLDLSRIDREQRARFDPCEGIDAALRLVQAKIPETVTVTTDLARGLEIEGREGDMNHVFLNLLDNAARAVGDAGSISVNARATDNKFVLEIGDSGAGIDPARSEWVMGAFNSTRAAGEGTGLGLAIARQVALQHGGSISIARSPLGGALFSLAVPLAPDAAPSVSS